jgi:hypothetical protein
MKKFTATVLTILCSTLIVPVTACTSNDNTTPTTENYNSHSHDWVAATCTQEQTCRTCGETTGTTLEHTWIDATCTTPKTCSICGTTTGSAISHVWNEATCTTPKTCSICGTTTGSTISHVWNEATCTTPKTCSVCQTVEGNAIGHNYIPNITTPTCSEKGYTTYKCSNCNDSYIDDYTDITGHNYNNGVCIYCNEANVTFKYGIIYNNYNDTNDAYQYYVICCDANGEPLHAKLNANVNVSVSLTITNKSSVVVYNKTYNLSTNNFSLYTSESNGQILGYKIEIPFSDISKGTTANGTLSVNITSNTTIKASMYLTDLPMLETKVELPETPVIVKYYSSSGTVYSACNVTNIRYEVSNDDLYIYFSAEKTYDYKGDSNSSSCKIGWKLYDEEGYVIDSGIFYSDSISVGEKFKDGRATAWNCIELGKNYRLEILNVK